MLRSLCIATAMLISAASSAQAQTDYPTKPITIIVPFAAGGASDTNVRLLADQLTKILGQPVLVENKPGGGTVIGMTAVLQSEPDGYTWGQISGSYTINPNIRKLPYNALEDFTALTVFQRAPLAMVAPTSFGPSTMAEVLEESKKRTLSFSSSGLGSSSHMAGELVQSIAGVKWEHVPYSGGMDFMADLLAGRVDFGWGTWSDLRPHVETGKLKLIAISYPEKVPDYPDAPILTEIFPEMKDKPSGAWVGLNTRKGVPEDVLAKIDAAIKQATEVEEWKKKVLALGGYPEYLSREEANTMMKTETDAWAKVVKDQNIKVE